MAEIIISNAPDSFKSYLKAAVKDKKDKLDRPEEARQAAILFCSDGLADCDRMLDFLKQAKFAQSRPEIEKAAVERQLKEISSGSCDAAGNLNVSIEAISSPALKQKLVEPLIYSLYPEKDPCVRRKSVQTLGKLARAQIKLERIIEALAARLNDTDINVLFNIFSIFEDLSALKMSVKTKEKMVWPLIGATSHDDKNIRVQAVRVLGEFAQSEVSISTKTKIVHALFSTLQDGEWVIRVASAESLENYLKANLPASLKAEIREEIRKHAPRKAK